MHPLLFLALAEPLTVPPPQRVPDSAAPARAKDTERVPDAERRPRVPDTEPEEPDQPELVPVGVVALRDDRYSLRVGVSVSAGAAWVDRWIAAATLALDFHAEFGRLELVLSPHVTVHVNRDIAALFGFEGQAVITLSEYVAVGAGTAQVVSVSRYQTGAVRIGPSVRPFIARMGIHRISLQVVWLLLGFNERTWPSCDTCNERPAPYYTLGYGVAF